MSRPKKKRPSRRKTVRIQLVSRNPADPKRAMQAGAEASPQSDAASSNNVDADMEQSTQRVPNEQLETPLNHGAGRLLDAKAEAAITKKSDDGRLPDAPTPESPEAVIAKRGLLHRCLDGAIKISARFWAEYTKEMMKGD